MIKKILVIDDHEIVVAGLELLFLKNKFSAILQNAISGQKALEVLESEVFDLVILDVNLPDTDTFYLLELILMRHADQKILVYTSSSEETYGRKFMKNGAYGFLNKASNQIELMAAISQILNGHKYLSENMKNIISTDYLNTGVNDILQLLSEREIETLKYMTQGLSNKEICTILNIHPSTMSTYKIRIYEKLKVSNLIELKKLTDTAGF